MGSSSTQTYKVDQTKIGFPYSNNKYWRMIREGKTGQILKQFQNGTVDCYQIIQQSSKHTIVHEAIVLDRREMFKICQVYGANWQQPDANGVTPFMKAVGLNRQYYIDRLIELGVKITAVDARGRTAADYARLYNNEELAERLDDLVKQTV